MNGLRAMSIGVGFQLLLAGTLFLLGWNFGAAMSLGAACVYGGRLIGEVTA